MTSIPDTEECKSEKCSLLLQEKDFRIQELEKELKDVKKSYSTFRKRVSRDESQDSLKRMKGDSDTIASAVSNFSCREYRIGDLII